MKKICYHQPFSASFLKLIYVLFILSLSSGMSFAAGEETEDALAQSFASVVDHTFTFTGREFTTRFTAKWAEHNGKATNDIVIRERPAGSRGSLITVEYRFRQIYANFFSPNRTRLKEAAEMAAVLAVQYVGETDIAQLLFRDPDLAQDELK